MKASQATRTRNLTGVQHQAWSLQAMCGWYGHLSALHCVAIQGLVELKEGVGSVIYLR